MKPLEQLDPNGENEDLDSVEGTRGNVLEDISGVIDDETAKAEAAQEVADLRKELEALGPKIEQLSRKMEAVMKSPLTDKEAAERDAYVQKMTADAEKNGTHPEFVQRLRNIAREEFEKKLRNKHISDSPQGQELERLKNRQFDMTARLQQLESKEEK